MADEGQTPRYSTASSGSNQAAQETNEASSTPDNDSSDKEWNDMLNDWYEQTIGSPRIAPTSGATSNFEPNMEYYEADDPFFSFDVYDNGSAGVPYPTFSRSDWDKVASRSRTGIEQPSATPENYTSNRGGTYNVKPVPEHGEASHVSTYTTATGMNGLPVPASSDGAYNSDPSTSHEGIEETMQGCDASQPGDSAEALTPRQGNPADDKPWVCSFYMEEFTCAADLKNHNDINVTDRIHRCLACSKLFKYL
ncbi:hypothetical protein HPB52_000473 [Rhipicephalus sanguineus]|uniref:Uncharacterized protein n=1 Tax=Rhipicephalus sanguineus TaxID=34632 RepID=A0A9D4PBF4_RHISA|nr:hypothetical protein HPB52_000473 [Rhipicephalus sanguineus]